MAVVGMPDVNFLVIGGLDFGLTDSSRFLLFFAVSLSFNSSSILLFTPFPSFTLRNI